MNVVNTTLLYEELIPLTGGIDTAYVLSKLIELSIILRNANSINTEADLSGIYTPEDIALLKGKRTLWIHNVLDKISLNSDEENSGNIIINNNIKKLAELGFIQMKEISENSVSIYVNLSVIKKDGQGYIILAPTGSAYPPPSAPSRSRDTLGENAHGETKGSSPSCSPPLSPCTLLFPLLYLPRFQKKEQVSAGKNPEKVLGNPKIRENLNLANSVNKTSVVGNTKPLKENIPANLKTPLTPPAPSAPRVAKGKYKLFPSWVEKVEEVPEVEKVEPLVVMENILKQVEFIIEKWNTTLATKGYPVVTKKAVKVREQIKTRLLHFPDIKVWKELFKKIEDSAPFLSIKPWFDLQFVTRTNDNLEGVKRGKYDFLKDHGKLENAYYEETVNEEVAKTIKNMGVL